MGFLDRIRYGGAPQTPQDADSLALRQLAGRGADLTKPRHIVHFVLFSDEASARAAGEAIEAGGWGATIEPPSEAGAEWSVKADGHRTVGPDTVAAFRSWFENVASAHGGEYDGWEASAKP